MPIIPQWHNEEKTIYLFHFTSQGISDWDEYRQAVDRGLADIMNVTYPVVVYFAPGKTPMPPGNPLPHIRYALRLVPRHVLAVINIVDNHFAASILNWLLKISPYSWCYIVRTQEEADALANRLQTKFEKHPHL